MLVEKVKRREQDGWLPIHEKAEMWATAPSGSNYPPVLHKPVCVAAATMLYVYFENRIPGDDGDTWLRNLGPNKERVKAEWQRGRNMRSIRLLAILSDEVFFNMPYYLPSVDLDTRIQYARSAAYQLGIENDWPELNLAQQRPHSPRPQGFPQIFLQMMVKPLQINLLEALKREQRKADEKSKKEEPQQDREGGGSASPRV